MTEGRALYAELFPQVLRINRELLAVLPPAEVDYLDHALDTLQRQAQALVARAELPKADRRRGGRKRAWAAG